MIYSSSMTIDKARSQIEALERQLEQLPPNPQSVEQNAIRTQINTLQHWLKNQEDSAKRENAIAAATGIYCGSSEKYLADLLSHRGPLVQQCESRLPAYKGFFEQQIEELDQQIAKLREAIANADKS